MSFERCKTIFVGSCRNFITYKKRLKGALQEPSCEAFRILPWDTETSNLAIAEA